MARHGSPQLRHTTDQNMTVEDANDVSYTIKVGPGVKLRHCQPSSMQALDDMINMHELFDGAILNTLRDRYR